MELLLSTRIFSGFQADPAGKYLLNVKGPALYLIGPYKISGRVLVLPIQGVGQSNITLGMSKSTFASATPISFRFFTLFKVEPDMTMTFDGKSVKRNSHEYLGIENAKLTFKVNR